MGVSMKKVYLDYGATTPVDSQVISAMKPYFDKIYGNPSSIHSHGVNALDAIEESRKHVASIINAKPEEIIFTSGGTEADNLAIKGITSLHEDKKGTKGPHIITTEITEEILKMFNQYPDKVKFPMGRSR